MPAPPWLRALDHRDFRIFWGGQLVSQIGTWMQSVAQAWLVLELTNSPFRLGVIGSLQFGPMLLLSFVAGAVVDRLPKRRLIIGTQLTFLAQAVGLSALVWTGHVRYWQVAVLATLFGLANALDQPARQSFVIELVGRENLVNAVALNSAAFNSARIVGPAVAGLLIARYGPGAAFFVNGVSFVGVLAALLAIRVEGLPRSHRGESIAREIGEGVRYALGTRLIVFVLGLVASVSVFVFNYSVLVPLLARDVLRVEARGFGFLMAAIGVGALAGAIALAVLGGSQPQLNVIRTAAVVLSTAMVFGGLVRDVWPAALILFVMGFAGIVFMASCNTTVQIASPDALRGRIMSLYTLVFAGVAPFGSLFYGSVIQLLGVSTGFLVGGVLALASVLGLSAWWRSRDGG
jgi:MFS family permease